MSDIYERINKVIDQNAEFTQAGLAHYLGKANSTLSQWLSQKRPIPADCIIPICEYLNVTIMWLLTGNDSKEVGLSSEEQEWIDLYRKFPPENSAIKNECIGFVKGYIIGKIPFNKGEYTDDQ